MSSDPAPYITAIARRVVQEHERTYHKESNMPVVNTSQARIELSAAQAEAFADIVRGRLTGVDAPMPPMIWIEETNLGSTVAVGGKGMPWTLIDHGGEVFEMKDIVK